jgi:hypothetical protein
MTMTMMMTENQSSQSQIHVTAFWGTEDLALKASLNRLPGASMYGGGGGSVLTQHQSHNRIRTVNAILVTGHQADPVHCYKFHILQQICSPQYFTILFGTLEDDKKPGSIWGDTILVMEYSY